MSHITNTYIRSPQEMRLLVERVVRSYELRLAALSGYEDGIDYPILYIYRNLERRAPLSSSLV